MKNIKSNRIMTKLATLVTIIGLSLFLGTGAMAATTNTVGSAPAILIGAAAGGTAGTITIVESSAGALSGNIAIQLPTGASFPAGATPDATITSGNTIKLSGAATAVGTLTDTDADGKNDRATWTISATSTTTATILINDLTIALSASFIAGNVDASITSNLPGNPGLTDGTLVIATAINGEAAAQTATIAPPNVAIGGTTAVAIPDVKIYEATAGSLSKTAPNNTIVVDLPAGVNFETPTVTVAGADANGNLVFTSKDGKPYKIVITENGAEYTANATTVAAGVITFTYGVATASSDTATEVAALMNADTVVNSLISVAASGTGASATIVTAGSFLSIPTADVDAGGVLFDNTYATGGLAGATLTDSDADGSFDKATWTIATASTPSADIVSLTNLKLVATSAAPVGDVNATVTSGTALNTTLKVAVAAKKGLVATVVASTTAAFSTTPTALTTLPSSPAGRVNLTIPSIMIVENFQDDLVTNDAVTLTLPAGITFAQQATVEYSDVTQLTYPDPTGFSTLNITLTGASAARGGLLIGDATTNKITVNVADTVAVGDVVGTLSGKLAGVAFTPINVTLFSVVESGITIAPNASIPTVGIGATNKAIGAFTMKETAAKAFLSNGSSVIVTLPTGVTWNAAPTATISGTGLAFSASALSASNSVATFSVTSSSTAASTVTVKGNVNISSSVAPGTITATISGTAGAAGTVDLVTTTDGVVATATSVKVLESGLPTQSIGDIQLKEAFKAALSAGSFRLLTNAGTWASAAPTITVTPAGFGKTTTGSFDGVSDDAAATNWDFETTKTYTESDTLIVSVPTTASLSASTITLSGLKLNVAPGTPEGPVQVTLVDGDTGGANSAGIKATELFLGNIGEIGDLVVDPAETDVAVSSTVNVAVTGGLGSYTVATADATIATATVASGVVTITGVAEGTVDVTVSDSASPTADTAVISVTVSPAAELTVTPATTTVYLGTPGDVTVAGGIAGYTAVSSDTAIATVAVAGSTVTITGVAEGSAVITITDTAATEVTVDVTVTDAVPATPLPIEPTVVVPDTPEAIAVAPVFLGEVAVNPDGNKMDLTMQFTAYEADVDLYAAVMLPDGVLWFIDAADTLSLQAVPFRAAVTAPQTATLFADFEVCTPFGTPALPEGTWTAFWLIAPANGGDLSLIDFSEGSTDAYELGFYSFETGCAAE